MSLIDKKKDIEKSLIEKLNGIDLKRIGKKEINYFNKKKILITGVSGLIGINLLFFFNKLNQKKNFSVYVDGTYNTSIFKFIKSYFSKNKNINFFKIDLTDGKISKKNRYDIIFHCAGYGQPSKFTRNKDATYILNSHLVLELKKYLKKNGKFIFMSTTEIYSGNTNKCTEDATGYTGPGHPRSVYIDSKKFGESYIVNSYNNYLIFRVCLTYGAGVKLDDERVLNQVIMRSIMKDCIDIYGGLNQLRSNLYIDDAINMIIKTTARSKNQIFNLNNHMMTTLGEIFNLISKISNKKLIINPSRISGSPSIIRISNSKILKLLNYKIGIDLKEGLTKTRNWYKDLIDYYK